MPRARKPHTRQCNAYEAAVMRRRRGKSLPDDDAVIALGRQCSNSQHRGTRREPTPREAAMSAPVAPPAPKTSKKAPTRRSVDKPAPPKPSKPPKPERPAPDGQDAAMAVIWLAFAAAFACFNVFALAGPLTGVVTFLTGTEAAIIVVLMEVLACMLFANAIGMTHTAKVINEARWWRLPIALVGLGGVVGLITLEVGMGDMRDVTHQVGLMTQAAFAGSSEDAAATSATADMDALVKAHAWISMYVQRGFGVVVPLLTMMAVLPLDTLIEYMFRRRPKPTPAPASAASPRTEEEPLGDKVARFPLGSSRA